MNDFKLIFNESLGNQEMSTIKLGTLMVNQKQTRALIRSVFYAFFNFLRILSFKFFQ